VRVDVVTLFPEMVETLLRFGVTGRAVERGLLTVTTWDPRADDPRPSSHSGRPALWWWTRNGDEGAAAARYAAAG
jgi:hypothetical protein